MNRGILVVSFGTSYDDTRELNIGALENTFAEVYPDYQVIRAFTSTIIMDKLRERNINIPNVEEALEEMKDAGIEEVIVQPTHLIAGEEYDKLCKQAMKYKDSFNRLTIGIPLMYGDEDLVRLSEFYGKTFELEEDEALVLMGHGTEHAINTIYSNLQEQLLRDGYNHIHIGTVEAEPTVDEIISNLQNANYKKVVITPLMLVSGDHANNDMAGDDIDSWKSKLEARGYIVRVVLKGMGEYEEIRNMYLEHLDMVIQL